MTNTVLVPPAAEVRKKIAAAVAETRYLRRLLRLSKEAEEAQRLQAEASSKGSEGGAT